MAVEDVEADQDSSPVRQALNWARCHPGILLFGSLALAALVAKPRVAEVLPPERRLETEADFVDGEDPLFI